VRITSDLERVIGGRHVLLVEDIVDTGLTLAYLRRALEARHPASLKICTLLDKRARREVEVALDYVGFPVEDVYVVGYGFDYDGLYRNLPHVAALEDV
jgi:hypoxanthine phosphoribosyltransferase